jgi:ATP-dependent protease ClpP protease subunit
MFQMPTNLNKLRATWRLLNDASYDSEKVSAFKVNNFADVTNFHVYDVIGLYDDYAENFVKAVSEVSTKEINLYINSMGGFVWDAVSMYDALLNAPQRVNVEINGIAASAASFLAMAGDSVKIAKPGRMMIHDAQGVAAGSPADFREYADLLDNVSNDIAGIYAKRAGGSPKAWRSAMSATTWYSSSQAIDSKLADGLTGSEKNSPDNRTKLIQARFNSLKKGQ